MNFVGFNVLEAEFWLQFDNMRMVKLLKKDSFSFDVF